MGLTYRERAAGLGLATAGVGLSARRSTGPDLPVVTAELVLDDVPAGATVERAYLYWVTFGAGDDSVTLKGSALTGALIGTSSHTCWGAEPWSLNALNRVYRADVTDIVDANGSYTIAGFPSGAATADTQGAGLVVVFSDPADDQPHELLLHDGSGTISPDYSFAATLTAPAPGELVSARLHVGAGDGQSDLADGAMYFSTKLVPVPDGAYWKGASGTYWDDQVFDVTSLITLDGKSIPVRYSYFTDCVVWAYHALVVTTVDQGGGAGGAGAGGAGAGGMATGAGGESETPIGGSSSEPGSGGAEPAGDAGQPARGGRPTGRGGDAGDDGGATNAAQGGQAGADSGGKAKDDGGCGCRLPAPAPTPLPVAGVALALLWLGRRARACRRR